MNHLIVKLYLIIGLTTITLLGYSQRDTLLVKKDPLVIKQKVFYTNTFNPYESKSNVSFSYFQSSKTSNTFEDDIYNSVTFKDQKTRRTISIIYIKTKKSLEYGIGLGIRTNNQNISQSAFTKLSYDSTANYKKDTIESFLSTIDGVTTELFIIDSNKTWKKEEIKNDTSSESILKSFYLRIPIHLGYTFHKKRWSIGLRAQLVANFRVSQDGDVSFFNPNHESVNLTSIFLNKSFVEFSPQVELGYNLDMGIGFFLSYRRSYLITDMISLEALNQPPSGSVGVGAKYFF